ncbi:MAG: glycoside hydrolase family 28 protein [Bacteroidales bacterium]|nr:glycoside hydrolase family 28 protein [Bacteroidales bacterium]
MNRTRVARLLIAAWLVAVGTGAAAQKKGKVKTDDIWAQGVALAESIKAPEIANKEYKITDFGARKDADALTNMEAINKAIDEASSKGGGRVVVPYGQWLTGPITMKSNVDLHIENGATLLFSTDRNHYLPVVRTRWEGIDCYNLKPLIYAKGEKNMAITGSGTIDGQASNEHWWYSCGAWWYGYKPGMLKTNNGNTNSGRPMLGKMEQEKVPVDQRIMTVQDALRPQLINFYECEQVMIEGVTLRNSPFWVIHPCFVNNMIVRGVTIISHGPNSDGCDPESSKNVLIEDCYFDTGDDCIAIKSGRNNDGRAIDIPSENIVVRRCRMKNGHGGVVIGSEITSGYRNLWVEDCDMDSPELERVIRIKSNTCRGGVVENVYVRNVRVGQCKEAVLKINLDYDRKEVCDRSYPPVVRNINLENVTSKKSEYGVLIIGLEDKTNVEDVTVKNCKFEGVEKGNKTTGLVKNVKSQNLIINGKKTEL